MAFRVEMLACCLVQMVIGNISLMFTKPILQRPVGFSNILHWANATPNTINYVPIFTTDLLVYLSTIISGSGLHNFSRFDKGADWTVVTWDHSRNFSFGPEGWDFWDLCSYSFVTNVLLPLISY